MIEEQVVLVDKQDYQIGVMDKLEAHKGEGTLHRAISVLLYRVKNGAKEVLLQKRGNKKPLWPFYWSNTVCTHPRPDELPIDCAVRRLREEMGIAVKKSELQFVTTLTYEAKYNEQLSEHELDHVFIGKWDGNYTLNIDEAADAKWTTGNKLLEEMKNIPDTFTPWFQLLMKREEIKHIFKN